MVKYITLWEGEEGVKNFQRGQDVRTNFEQLNANILKADEGKSTQLDIHGLRSK